MPRPYPFEFRVGAVALVRAGKPIEAAEFSRQVLGLRYLTNWIA